MHCSGRFALAICCCLALTSALWLPQSRAGATSPPTRVSAPPGTPLAQRRATTMASYTVATFPGGLTRATVTEAEYPCDTGCTVALLFLFASPKSFVSRLVPQTNRIAAVYATGSLTSLVLTGFCYFSCQTDVYASNAGTDTVTHPLHLAQSVMAPDGVGIAHLARCPLGFRADGRWYALRAVHITHAGAWADLTVTAQAGPLPRC